MKIPSETQIPKRSIKALNRACAKLGDSYEFISFNLTTITYKHLKCGTILNRPTEYFYLRPKCTNAACINARRKSTTLRKYGVNNISQNKEIKKKVKNTCLKHYGVEYSLQSAEVQDKSKVTCMAKYGHEHANQADEVKNKIKKTCLEKYGVGSSLQSKAIKDKIKKTNLKKYGVENPLQSGVIKDKIKKTNLKKYGVEYPTESTEIRDKCKNTLIKNYGVLYPTQSAEIRERSKDTCLRKYGVPYSSQSNSNKEKYKETVFKKTLPSIIEKLKKYNYEFLDDYRGQKYCDRHKSIYKQYKIKHVTCGNVFYDDVFKIPRCPKCFRAAGVSQKEKYWCNYVESLGFDVIENDKSVISPKEIDIYIPDLKIGFEYNGTYWHSNKFKSDTYHEDKTQLALKKGVTLIHLWEDWSDEDIKNQIDYVLLDFIE